MAELLYDYKRDGEIKPGEVSVVYEDGATERVREVDLYEEQRQVEPPVSGGKERWSEGGQIYYLDGFAWGINTELQAVCLGSVAAVKAAIDNPKLKSGNPEVDNIIAMERRELANGERSDENKPVSVERFKPASDKRTRLAPHSKYKPVDTRHLKAKQRLSSSEA